MIKPIWLLKKSNERYIIDLGKEIIGCLHIELESLTSNEIELHYGEELNSDGSVKYNMNTSNYYMQRWKLKEGFQSIDTYNLLAYRYVEIIGLSIDDKIKRIDGIGYYPDFYPTFHLRTNY